MLDWRSERAAYRNGGFPPGDTTFSPRRTQLFQRNPLPVLLDAYERHGPVFTLRLLYLNIVFAIGPEANHFMTVTDPGKFSWRDGSLGDMIPLIGDGLLTTDGDYHRRARKIMLPAFHREQIAASAEAVQLEIDLALERWRDGQELDLYAWTRRLALRVAMRALLGFDPDRSEREADLAHEFEVALGFYGKPYTAQMMRGPGSPYRRMLKARAHIDRVIYAEVARRRAADETGQDILGLLLGARDEDGRGFSDEELRDQLMTLLFAGHDTTTSTVAFLFYELGRNPHELARLQAEPDERLERALDETLRMYPPAWLGPRRSTEAFELCGAHVPAGILVNYCSWASHHLPEVFPEPESFRPDRFLPEERAKLPKGAYVPFGGGSRTCIGMRFAELEIRLIAAAILRRFTLEVRYPEPLRVRQMPTLSPIGGMPVVVRER